MESQLPKLPCGHSSPSPGGGDLPGVREPVSAPLKGWELWPVRRRLWDIHQFLQTRLSIQLEPKAGCQGTGALTGPPLSGCADSGPACLYRLRGVSSAFGWRAGLQDHVLRAQASRAAEEGWRGQRAPSLEAEKSPTTEYLPWKVSDQPRCCCVPTGTVYQHRMKGPQHPSHEAEGQARNQRP